MSEIIQAIFVPSTETRPLPKPHTEYQVEVHAAVQTWSVWKRYSDFVKLHEHLTTIFAGHPPPVGLPTKRIFPPTFSDPTKINDRRRQLEEYLRAILSNRDNRWRKTEVWRVFLEIPSTHNSSSSSSSNGHGTPAFTSESWLNEYTDMTDQMREVRSHVNRRATHIARNEISASHNCTVQAKKVLLTLATRISALEAGLQQGLGVADGECRRREDMVNQLKEEKDTLAKLVNSGRLEQHQSLMSLPRNAAGGGGGGMGPIERATTTTTTTTTTTAADQLSSSSALKYRFNQPAMAPSQQKQAPQSRIGPGRAFGVAAAAQVTRETEATRGLDNDGLLQYQQGLMNDQDAQIEQFSGLLARQKQLGLAIGDEFEVQNQLLDELDSDVDRTALKLKFASKKLGTMQ